jgi:urease accessory protein
MNRRMKLFSAAAVLLAWSGVASAHVGHEGATFGNGLAHPFGGLDHLLAMVAVGLLGAKCGLRWRYLLPIGFVAGLGLGGLLGAFHVGLPAVELSISLSVLLFGGLLAVSTRVSPWVLAGIVLVAGIPHGHAHLTEAGAGSIVGYGVGMVLGSALLHAGGLLLGLAIGQAKVLRDRWQWVAGPAIACAGLVLAVTL